MTRRVAFTEDAARRITAATRAYERGNRDQPPIKFRDPGGDGDPPRLGKTTAAWLKGTTATIDLYEEGSPPTESKNTSNPTLAGVMNKFADIGANKWVMVTLSSNGYWYVTSAEC